MSGSSEFSAMSDRQIAASALQDLGYICGELKARGCDGDTIVSASASIREALLRLIGEARQP